MARKEKIASAVAAAQKPVAAAPAEEATRSRFDDLAVQVEVLSPETVAFTFEVLRTVRREEQREIDGASTTVIVEEPTLQPLRVVVPTRFTLGDLRARRIMDDLEAFRALVFAEANRYGALGAAAPLYLEVAFSRASVREEIRTLLVRLGTVEEPGADPRPPTAEELADGMSGAAYATVGLYLMNRVSSELERRKKTVATARAAAGAPSASASSTPASSSASAGRSTTSTS